MPQGNVTIRIEGIDALQRRLAAMPTKIANRALRQGLRTTANRIKDRLKAGTPRVSGAGFRSVRVSTRASVRRGAYAAIRYQRKPAFYLRLREYGAVRQGARPFFGQAVRGYEEDVKRNMAADLKDAVERNQG